MNPDLLQPSLAEIGEFLRDQVRIADDRQSSHAVGLVAPLSLEFPGIGGVAGDFPLGENRIDRRPVGVIDDATPIILLRLRVRRMAGDQSLALGRLRRLQARRARPL